MYKQIKNIITNNIENVQRLSDGAYIPLDNANTEYQEYLEWVAEGNQPEKAGEEK